MTKRRLGLATVVAGVCALAPAAAQAHVSFHPNAIPQGAYVTVYVRVPNEVDHADISSVKIKAKNLPGYFPGASDLWLKLYFEDESKVIVGGQIIGKTGSALRINALVAATTKGMRLDELYTLDTAYAPPFSPVWDPLLIAAKLGMK